MPPIILGKSPDASSFTVNDIKGRKPSAVHAYSVSQLKMAMTCQRQRYFRYRLGFVIPPPGVVIIGRGTHKGIEMSLRNRQRKGSLLPLNEIKEIAADETNRIIDNEPVALDDGETGGNTVDCAVKLAELWHKEIGVDRKPIPLDQLKKISWPKMTPRKGSDGRDMSSHEFDGIEAGFELTLKGMSKPIIGFVDFVEHRRAGEVFIRDNKTTGRRKNEIEMFGFQLATYSLVAMKAALDVKGVGLDVLIRPRPKTPKGEVDIMETNTLPVPLLQQTYQAFRWLERVDAEAEYPVNIGDHCNWCGYRKLCEKTAKVEKMEV